MTNPTKIAVAGSHSTGKTSFLERLKPALEANGWSVAYVHDSAAEALVRGFPILADHTFESTAWLMAHAIELETEAALDAEIILVDRPVHDALGYLLAALEHSGRAIDSSKLRILEEICSAWAAEYDFIFLTEIDPTVPLGDDRDGDLLFRDRASAKVREVIESYFGGRWTLLGPSSHDEILACVRRAI